MGGGVNATLYQGKPAYAVFTEYVIMDFASYLATFGGIMGKLLLSFLRWITDFLQAWIVDSVKDINYLYANVDSLL